MEENNVTSVLSLQEKYFAQADDFKDKYFELRKELYHL